MSRELDRHCTLIELSPEYCDMTADRLGADLCAAIEGAMKSERGYPLSVIGNDYILIFLFPFVLFRDSALWSSFVRDHWRVAYALV